jgi:type I restriction enzyme R subunit
VNRAVQAALQGRKRALLTLCTGAGKTAVAFQICWKLWSARWNSKGINRNPKILFLADRNVLVDDPMAKDFSPFGDARHKIAGGLAVKSRDMYFAIYQSIARDENRPGLYREYARDFFDLIIIDECHRGSARDDSNWREILEWFEPATQIGMTATPRREDNVDTYNYFGDPLYEYSLAQGIADGFLAPYRVHRVISDYDAAGCHNQDRPWCSPSPGSTSRPSIRCLTSGPTARLTLFNDANTLLTQHKARTAAVARLVASYRVPLTRTVMVVVRDMGTHLLSASLSSR